MRHKESESNLQRRCQSIMKQNDCFVIKTHGDMYSRVGIPDLIACIPSNTETMKKLIDEGWFKNKKIGIFVGFELKRENQLNDVSDAQEIVGREIKSAGGLWFAIDDSDMLMLILSKLKGEL